MGENLAVSRRSKADPYLGCLCGFMGFAGFRCFTGFMGSAGVMGSAVLMVFPASMLVGFPLASAWILPQLPGLC